MSVKTTFISFGLLLVVIGSFVQYFQGYKDSSFVSGLSVWMIYIGWLTLLFTIVGKFLLKGNKVSIKKNKREWLKQNGLIFISISSVSILLITNLIFVSKLMNNRVSKILSSEPINRTTATIKRIENRYSRGGSNSYAIIEYKTENDIFVKQSILNYQNYYSIGQKYELEYSIEFPEMFIIGRHLDEK